MKNIRDWIDGVHTTEGGGEEVHRLRENPEYVGYNSERIDIESEDDRFDRQIPYGKVQEGALYEIHLSDRKKIVAIESISVDPEVDITETEIEEKENAISYMLEGGDTLLRKLKVKTIKEGLDEVDEQKLNKIISIMNSDESA